jgi:RNA polymerase sigma-70 factor (ECF subfamily)
MAELDEQYLISRCQQQNDRQAFNELVIRYQDRIFNTVYRIVNDHPTAADICQESFLKAYQSINGFKGQSGFLTWLYQIAVNLCYNYKRSQKRFSTLPDNDLLTGAIPGNPSDGTLHQNLSVNPASALEDREQTFLIQQALDALDNELRTIVVLKDIEECSYEEISKALKCSIGSVRAKLCKARIILKDKLSKLI